MLGRKILTLLSIVSLAVASFLSVSSVALAARVEMQEQMPSRGDFMVGPTFFDIQGNPGETIVKEVQVDNRKGEEWTFNVGVEDFQGSPTDPSSSVLLQGAKSGQYGAKDWIVPELRSFTIKHGERQFFNVTINIPKNADAGDHYASVLVSAPPKEGDLQQGATVKITSRTGILFFIRVNGNTKEEGRLSLFEGNKTWSSDASMSFSTVFDNSGTVRLRPEGKIEVTSMFGNKSDEIEVKPYNVLRNSVRSMGYDWSGQGLYFGKYKATIKLSRGYGDNVDEISFYFWIIPWKTILVFAVVLIIAALVLKYLLGNFEINIKKKEGQ